MDASADVRRRLVNPGRDAGGRREEGEREEGGGGDRGGEGDKGGEGMRVGRGEEVEGSGTGHCEIEKTVILS